MQIRSSIEATSHKNIIP